ncbi:MAG: c-type cytochrome [Gemmatimonadales bacterium]
MIRRTLLTGLALGAAGLLGALLDQGITRLSRAQEPAPPSVQLPASAASQDLAARFVAHPEHLRPGLVPPKGIVLTNPYAGNADAIATGAKLFVAYNCADCHGADGSGAMGPSLADGRWHFGGEPGEIFESIYQGRPEGMPAWGSLISRDQVWLLASYVKSLETNKDPTTENFTGATVERTGH